MPDRNSMALRDALWEFRRQQMHYWGYCKAFVVLQNAMIDGIVEQRPKSHKQLTEVPGIKGGRADKYGKGILELVAAFDPVNGPRRHEAPTGASAAAAKRRKAKEAKDARTALAALAALAAESDEEGAFEEEVVGVAVGVVKEEDGEVMEAFSAEAVVERRTEAKAGRAARAAARAAAAAALPPAPATPSPRKRTRAHAAGELE
ncbi:hypothetical protein HYH03_018138 [Edaphochlamys debaryana]|uniref:HRDC domain-containing protein n=1 Tax=Edaphochlamys debaryana TaxID=47281 RepID=A0A835XIK1_9CHLO|nr:hypothetical protein HYH03_018138 [Edaphochlamys debaryana]|eukprot:KAG2482961.1 hypothetical protein HYH03_018138 [Edaphochlamys debaryana]